MLSQFQRLLARGCLQRFPTALKPPQVIAAKPRPASPVLCCVHTPSFVKGFATFSNVRRAPQSLQQTALPRDALPAQDEQAAPPLPDPSPNRNAHSDAAAALPTNLITRISLVGASVGLLTPLYVAAGVGWIWQTYKPSTTIGVVSKAAVGLLFVGTACVNGWTLVTQHVLPFLFNHAEIVLPFAIANAAAAAVWYGIGESIFGLQRMSSHSSLLNALLPSKLGVSNGQPGVPIGGPVVGILSALTCFPLWAPLAERVWPQEFLNACDLNILADAYLSFLPVGLGTGALVGLGLHFALSPVFTGRIATVGGVPIASSLLLVVVALTLAYFYFCRFDYKAWEQRLDTDSCQMFWAHSATGQKATKSSDRLLNDTLWFMKGLAFLCNSNSMSNRFHFSFVNKRLLADALVAEAKFRTASHVNVSDAFDKSKLILHVYYGINFKNLHKSMMQLMHIEHDLRMALAITDDARRADVIQRCMQSKEAIVAKIRALSSNADATAAIDILLSDLPALESRLSTEAGQDFSKGTGIMDLLMFSLRTLTQSPEKSKRTGAYLNRKDLAYFAFFAVGSALCILLYASVRY